MKMQLNNNTINSNATIIIHIRGLIFLGFVLESDVDCRIGDFDGIAVGSIVGEMDGILVGIVVGIAVGSVVGEMDGTIVV